MPIKTPRILTISESDSSGATGIQGDIKTILALGGYAMTAITGLAAHGAHKAKSITCIAPLFVKEQIEVAISEAKPDAIKIGFLQDEYIINVVADLLEQERLSDIPVIIDPSIVSRSGNHLMNDTGIATLKRRLYLHTKVLTPNIKEAEILGVMRITDINDMRHAANMMRTLGVENVVLKGGRVENDKELYFVATPEEERIYQRPTVQTAHTVGAGDVLSSAIAVNLAKSDDVFSAVEAALDFMHQTIIHSSGFGYEAGSVNHAFHIENQPKLFHPEDIKIYKA